MILLPQKAYWNAERRTCLLEFTESSPAQSGEYVVRGSICWPMSTQADVLAKGIFLLGALHLKTGVLWILQQQAFYNIDHILRDDGGIAYQGLSQTLCDMWAKCYCSQIFWHSDAETHQRYRHQMQASSMVSPKPHMVEVHWTSDISAAQTVWARLQAGQLKHDKDGLLAQVIGIHAGNPDLKPGPEMMSAMTLCNGYDSYRWRAPVQDEEQVILVR